MDAVTTRRERWLDEVAVEPLPFEALIPVAPPALDRLPRRPLQDMAAAGREAQECRRVLEKAGLNLVGEVLREQGTFYEFNHYPEGDVYDPDTHSQYFYHAHRGLPGEHGHFHTFLRAAGMPPGVAPLACAHTEPWPAGESALSHLVAISMDAHGWPIGLFAVNRWVTGDTWYAAPDVVRMLDRFSVDHASPSWPVNRWITAMLRLFRPQIEALVQHRDRVISAWGAAHPGGDVFEDRRLEMTGYLSVSMERQLQEVEALLTRASAEDSGRDENAC